MQTQQKFLTDPYGQGFSLNGPVGFDIPASVKVTTDNTAVTDNGTVFFTGTANGSHLFRVNLTTGVVHDLGSFPVTVKSLALMNLPPQAPLQIPALPVIMVSQQAQVLVDIAPGDTVSAKGLPPCLTLNAKTGIISGRASAADLHRRHPHRLLPPAPDPAEPSDDQHLADPVRQGAADPARTE